MHRLRGPQKFFPPDKVTLSDDMVILQESEESVHSVDLSSQKVSAPVTVPGVKNLYISEDSKTLVLTGKSGTGANFLLSLDPTQSSLNRPAQNLEDVECVKCLGQQHGFVAVTKEAAYLCDAQVHI